ARGWAPAAAPRLRARLGRRARALGELGRGSLREPRRLVDLDPDPVAEAVPVVVAVPGLVDRVAGDGVDVAPRRPRTHRRERRELRGLNEVVHLAHLVVDLARRERARAVRAVAVDDRAHVEDDELAGANLAPRRLVVRERGVRPRGNDRRERRALGAELAHPLLGRELDLAFGAADDPALDDPPVDLVAELRGGGDRGELCLALAAAKA